MLLLDFVLGLFKFFCTDVFNFHVVRFIDTAISSGFRGWCRITGASPRLGAWGLCCESAPAPFSCFCGFGFYAANPNRSGQTSDIERESLPPPNPALSSAEHTPAVSKFKMYSYYVLLVFLDLLIMGSFYPLWLALVSAGMKRILTSVPCALRVCRSFRLPSLGFPGGHLQGRTRWPLRMPGRHLFLAAAPGAGPRRAHARLAPWCRRGRNAKWPSRPGSQSPFPEGCGLGFHQVPFSFSPDPEKRGRQGWGGGSLCGQDSGRGRFTAPPPRMQGVSGWKPGGCWAGVLCQW